jgi:hypothetical protein
MTPCFVDFASKKHHSDVFSCSPGVEAIKATVREKIELFGSAGKA